MTVIRVAEEHLAHLLPAHAHERIAAALAGPLPDSVNLTRRPPTDQGQSNSCTCHALVKGIEIVTGGYLGSMAGLYSGTGTDDTGRTLVDVLHYARNVGVQHFAGPVEGRNSDVLSPPHSCDPPAGGAASTFDLGEHVIDPVSEDLSTMCAASLAAGCPLYIASAVGSSFDSLTVGRIAQPDPTAVDGHALLVVGYRTNADHSRSFLVENSWGDWDEAGECWVSVPWLAACWEIHPLICTPGSPAGPSMLDRVRDAFRAVLP